MCSQGTFAAAADAFTTTAKWLDVVLKVFSWIWVVLAILVGKLMTNDFVYGSFMGLDVNLRKMRNIMKNFANFALGLMFVYMVLSNLFSADETIKKRLPDMLLAGVLINASWFLMGAVLDIATILIAAVGSFPGVFLADNPVYQQQLVVQQARRPAQINLNFAPDTGQSVIDYKEVPRTADQTASTPSQQKKLIDDVIPTTDQVSGPLIYIGASVFQFLDYPAVDVQTIRSYTAFTFVAIIKFAFLGAFVVFLVGMLVINIIRMMTLWVGIVFSPFIALFAVFGDKLGSLGKGVKDYLSAQNMVSLIFQPVMSIGGIGIIMIFLMAISQVIGTNNAKMGDTTILKEANTSKMEFGGVGEVDVVGNRLSGDATDGVQNFFGELLMSMLALFLLWALMSALLTSSKNPLLKGAMDMNKSLLKLANNIAMATPIPLP